MPAPTATPFDAQAANKAIHLLDEAVDLIEQALNVSGLERGEYTDRMAGALEDIGLAERALAQAALEAAEDSV